MKKKFSFIIFGLASLFANGQIQTGLVREINSGKKPVAGVQVSFIGAVPNTSDDNGLFRLAFTGKKPGDFVFLREISKEGYELVNGKDLKAVKISITNELGEDIIVAKKGVIDAAKKEYYEVSDKSLLVSFNKEKTLLLRKLRKKEVNEKEYIQQLKNFRDEFEKQQKNLKELADKFARVNFDDADTLYRHALQLFKSGNIEGCKKLLEKANMIERTELRLANRKRITHAKVEIATQEVENEKGVQNDISIMQLQIQTYLLSFEFANAEVLYEKLFLLDSSSLEILQSAADFFQNHHRYIKALHLFPKIINHSNASELQKINAYGSATLYTLFLNRFSEAEEYTLACLAADSTQTWIFANLAIAYLFQGKWEDAKAIYIQLKEQININDSFKAAFLQDLKELEAAGITHPDVAKARTLLEEK